MSSDQKPSAESSTNPETSSEHCVRYERKTTEFRRKVVDTREVVDTPTGRRQRTTTSRSIIKTQRVKREFDEQAGPGTDSPTDRGKMRAVALGVGTDSGGSHGPRRHFAAVKLSIRDCRSGDHSPSPINGDYYLELLHGDERGALWELTFPAVAGFFRARLQATVQSDGSLQLRASLRGQEQRIAWKGTCQNSQTAVVLTQGRNESGKKIAELSWPESVDAVFFENPIPRRTWSFDQDGSAQATLDQGSI